MQKKWAVLSLLVVAGCTIWFAAFLPATYFDYNFDKFFKPDDPTTEYFEKHKAEFGTDNDFVLVGIVSENGVFNAPFLDKVERLTAAFAKMPYVLNVTSPTNITQVIKEPLTGAIFERKLIDKDLEKDSVRIFNDPSLVSNIFSKTAPAVSIVIATEQKLTKDQCDSLATALNQVLSIYDFDAVHIAGRAIGQVVYIQKIQKEFSLFMAISLIFVLVLLFLVFRSFRGVLIPIVTVLLAVVWSIGILNLFGGGVSILLNMLPPVIFVVGMSDAVHLYSRYLEELGKGHSKEVAIRQMRVDTGLATFLTSLTTSIGFASLYFTGIPVLQEFGLLTAAGVMAAFVIAIILLPAWLSLTPIPQKTLHLSQGRSWETKLERAFDQVMLRRKSIFWIVGILTVIFLGLSSQIGRNNFLLEDLRSGEKLRDDFAFFDENFSGVRPFELGLKLKDGKETFLTPGHLQQLENLENYLAETYGANALTSPVTFSKEVNRSSHAGRNKYYSLPDDERDWKKNLKDLDRLAKAKKMQVVLNEDMDYARIFGRTGDFGAQSFQSRNDALIQFIAKENLEKDFAIEITGTGTLIDRTNQNIAVSLAKGLGVAFILIAIMMGLMFRSLRMVLFALIPNILPLLAVSSIMFLTGIDLKMSTSIIFTIAFGIAVDDTIHLLSRYRLEMANGLDRVAAMRKAYVHTGKALIVSSLIIFGGFISLCFSTFQSTFYIGLFVTLTLGFALLFDLTLLPAMVLGKKEK